MPTIEMIDPRAAPASAGEGAGPPLRQPIADLVIGVCTDDLWPAYDIVADQWTRMLGEGGAKILHWRSAQAVTQEGARPAGGVPFTPLSEVVTDMHFALVGLGNCGSCTSRTVDDTVEVLNSGIGAAAVVTAEFEAFARALARRRGWPEMRLVVLPFPLVTLPAPEIRRIAEDSFGRLLKVCTAP
jgi:hypothetical protein